MTEVMWKQKVPKGQVIIQEGDDGDYFYVVNDGNFEISQKVDGSSAENMIGRNESVGSIGKGKSFGELALLYFAPRAATITATSDSEVFVMARQQFKAITTKSRDE